jgi:hypothetical protein
MIRIYLSKQSHTVDKYQLYRDGKPTGEFINNKQIKKLLTTEQYKSFIEGDSIFQIDGQKWRARNYKAKRKPLTRPRFSKGDFK